jgi:hypothetical protein
MEGSGSGSKSGSEQMVTDSDPGGPKAYGAYGTGSTVLLKSVDWPLFKVRQYMFWIYHEINIE